MVKVKTKQKISNAPKFIGVLVLFAVALVAIILFVNTNSNGPSGKSFVSKDGWTEFDLGSSNLGGGDFLNYNKELVDAYGNPISHIHKTGHFRVEGNVVTCNFDNEQMPYKLEYKNVDGEDYLVDESGQWFAWDDPSKRK